jgi:hypothetical protein
MILKRLATALKRQDWFQVIIEILIVVIGIYLGLQVTQWAAGREERAQERVFLNRLHTDVLGVDEYQELLNDRTILDGRRAQMRINLSEVIDVLGGFDDTITLGPDHCTAIIMSHTNSLPNNSLATLSELISSGQISIIKSDDLKTALSEYLQVTETIARQLDHLNPIILVMARKYPELVKWDISAGAALRRSDAQNKCDFEKMVQSDAFINDISDNDAKQVGFEVRLSLLDEKLQNIHHVLDRELGISHEGETQ